MQPVLDCCQPYMAPFPSGYAWSHSHDCLVRANRGQKIARHAQHPAGSALQGESRLATWLRHPVGCGCLACVYIDRHLDEGDDDWDAHL